MQPCPSRYAAWLPRIGFGVMLMGFGVNHYRDIENFIVMSRSPFGAIPFIATAAGLLAYVVPALEIVGGALFATGLLKCVSKICILAALGGIMGWAGLGMALNTDQTTVMMMGQAFQGATMALVGYWVIKKMSCGMMCGTGMACACGKGGMCTCGTKSAKHAK